MLYLTNYRETSLKFAFLNKNKLELYIFTFIITIITYNKISQSVTMSLKIIDICFKKSKINEILKIKFGKFT